ncbi:MAG TPA: hypothetical protein VKQ27_07380 [Acetobacteraceae bacterium]|nr:hypothetical protein [Acetobacteraceae bacterium]
MTLNPRPVLETDVPRTTFIDHVSPALPVDWAAGVGTFDVPLAANGATVLNVTSYRQISLLVGTTKATRAALFMGKISGSTLSSRIEFNLDGTIHTFPVVGPEISLELYANRSDPIEKVQLWLYLTS